MAASAVNNFNSNTYTGLVVGFRRSNSISNSRCSSLKTASLSSKSSLPKKSCLQFPSSRRQRKYSTLAAPAPIRAIPNPKPRFRCSASSDSNPVSSDITYLLSILSNIPSFLTYYFTMLRFFCYLLSIKNDKRCHFTLRIVVRDDDHQVKKKLSQVMELYDAWTQWGAVSCCAEEPRIAAIVVEESVRCLLENEHLWVFGASKVSSSYTQLYENLSAILEEETFDDLSTSKSPKDPINCVEFVLQLCLIGEFNDGYCHTIADLAKALQKLHTNYHIKSATPEYNCFQVDKEKLDGLQGYSHTTGGKNSL